MAKKNGSDRSEASPGLGALLAARQRAPKVFYSDEGAKAVLELVASGGRITEICTGVAPFPTFSGWYGWLEDRPDLRRSYGRARLIATERLADEILSIPETEPDVARARLKVDARKWLLAKINPLAWGDKLSSDDAAQDHDERVTVIDVRSLNPTTREALKQALLAVEMGDG